MRIFYITNARIPTEKAHGYQIMKMCEAFLRVGQEVILIIPKRRGYKKKDPFNFYGIKKKFKIIKLPVIDCLWLPQPMPVIGYPLLVISFYLRALFLLKKELSRNDIIYTRDFESIFFLRKFYICYEMHKISRFITIFKKFFKNFTLIFTITSALRQQLIDWKLLVKNIFVFPDAMDLDLFKDLKSLREERASLSLPIDKKLVGYVGRFQTMGLTKGIECLLKSVSFLQTNNVTFVLIGGLSNEISYYKQICQRLNIDNKVIFVPFQKHSSIPKYLQAMDVLVIPSPKLPFYQYYSSPLKLFEYMASGKPIVASNLLALRDVLNERNSKLVDPDDPKSLANGIDEVLKNKEFATNIAKQARRDVFNYTWIKRAENITKIIKQTRQNIQL